jgi:SAM-dependent MidA family methyltransferase
VEIAGKMGKANRDYYSSKGKAIYSDFSTFAQGKALATCNAIEFVRNFSGRQGAVEVCEYGVGNGNFARVFLDGVEKRDKKLYSRVHYSLFDISEKMLLAAKKTLGRHAGKCSFAAFDAARQAPSFAFDYCRMNELLSDLPAELHSRKGAKAPSHSVVGSFLLRVDDGREIPFCFAAEKFLLSLCRRGRAGFRIDVFDYGFYKAEDVFLLPREEWNRLIARRYGKQITVDLNFLQLSAALRSDGFSASVEGQKEYCERVLGRRLKLSHGKKGLDYAEAKGGEFGEADGFCHLRVEL